MDMDYTDYLGRTKSKREPTPGYHNYYTKEDVGARLTYDNRAFHDDTGYNQVPDRNMISDIPQQTESNRSENHTRSIDVPRDVPLDEHIPRHPPSKRSCPNQLPRKRSRRSKMLVYSITAIILALTLTVILLVIFLLRQGSVTTKGTLHIQLRLAEQFRNGMVDSTTSVFKSTEKQLCSGAEGALRSGSTFPHQTTIDCKVDSLRSGGSIIATLQLILTGTYAIPDNEHYVQAIESYGKLGSFTLIPGSVVVLSAIYTRDGVETRVTSATTPATLHINFLLSPSGHLRIDCNVGDSPNDWNEIRMMSADANIGVVATGYENGTTHTDNSTYELSLEAVDSNVSIGLAFPNTTNYSSIRSNYTCQLLRTGNIVAETTEYVTIPDVAINDSVTAPGEAITISCNVRYPPSIWEQFNIISVNSTDIHGRGYPNGTVVGGNSSYTVELQQNSEDMTLSIFFSNTATHCTARGSYLCMFSFTGSVIEQTSSVIITDLASGLTLVGNNTVEEGGRFSVNCSGRLAREGGNLNLYVRSKNSSDFVMSVEVPTTFVVEVDDSCYRYITQTYGFLANSDLNGTEFQCVATNDMLGSKQSSRSIDMVVHFAEFNTDFHLQNTTWNPAFANKNSPEFKSFTDKIQDETDFVYSQSILKDNYKKSKVTGLEPENQARNFDFTRPESVIVIIAMFINVKLTINDGSNNQVTTILTPTDILTAFTDTLPKVSGNLTDNSPLSSLNSATITITPGPDTVYDCVTKTDVVFLLDASGSIGSRNFILMKYFIQNYTAGLWLGPDTIQVSVAKYSSHPNNEFWLNEYHGVTGNQSIAKAINDIQYTGGGTYIASGLNFVMNNSLNTTNGARANASKVIILMTDGIAQDYPGSVADKLKREGVLIACVAIGSGIRYDQLQSIAYNDTYIFNASDFNVLARIASTVRGSSCELRNKT